MKLKKHIQMYSIFYYKYLDDGRLTDSKGRTVDFRNTVVIMTSNVGADALKYQKNLGFSIGGIDSKYKDMKGTMLEELKKAFRPEFLNRIDEMIVFHSLEKEHLKEIVSMMANALTKRLKEQDIALELTDAALEKIAEEGVRSTIRCTSDTPSITKTCRRPSFRRTIKRECLTGQVVVFDYKDGEFIVRGKDLKVEEQAEV